MNEIKKPTWKAQFSNEDMQISAWTREQAAILAKAQRIKQEQSYEIFKLIKLS